MSRTEVPELAEFEDPFLVSSRRSQSGSQAPPKMKRKRRFLFFILNFNQSSVSMFLLVFLGSYPELEL